MLGIGYLVAIDLLRDRGEPDSDTLSEVIRDTFRVQEPAGRLGFTVALAAGSALLWRHICKDT